MKALNQTLPILSVDKAVDTLSSLYISAVKSRIPFRYVPSVMLWGAPGVGKSQAIRQMGAKIEAETGKRCIITDVRLLLFNPIDLRGIPTSNQDKTLSVWLKPKIFDMDTSDSVVNVLFLDEISAAPQSVQAAAYQITLDRVIGEHSLPENCIVIAAGNRVTDKSVAFKMPRALANRLCHMEIESNFDSWKSWAIRAGISPKVAGFLSFRSDLLIENESLSDSLAFPTPRSWEMVSNLLKLNNDSIDGIFSMIAGCVGTGVANEFRSWCKIFSELPKIEDIFAGKRAPMPKDTDALYALVSSMTVYAREHKNDMKAIENSINYALNMPADFSFVLLKGYLSIEDDYRSKLMKIPTFAAWIRTKGKYLNGN